MYNIDEKYINHLISEEISKSEINSIISNKIDEIMKSSDFKKEIRKIISDTLEVLYKTLFQKKGFWQSSLK